ncbi:MAG: hypothetical protein ACYS8W_15600 [Planctomycetota bacterium]|jgi:phage FluMu protein Com
MAIKNRCATCNHILSVPDDFGDMTVRCPNCGGWMRIVDPEPHEVTTPSGRKIVVKQGRRKKRQVPFLRAPMRQNKNVQLLRTISVAFVCLAYVLGLLVPAIGVLYLHLSPAGGGSSALSILFFILTLVGAVVVYFIFKFLAAFADVLADLGEDQQAAIAVMKDICMRVEPEVSEIGGKV